MFKNFQRNENEKLNQRMKLQKLWTFDKNEKIEKTVNDRDKKKMKWKNWKQWISRIENFCENQNADEKNQKKKKKNN